MAKLRFLTSGESHGPGLTVIVEGLPLGLRVDRAAIDADLKRRQGGYGRGGRMKIESDHIELRSGVRHGSTTGGPVTLLIENRDYENWRDVMSPDPAPDADPERRRLRYPRPGHADLAGALKYQTLDLRNVLERASARETAARVAAGALARALLLEVGTQIRSHVLQIGAASVEVEGDFVPWGDLGEVDDNPVRCADLDASKRMIAEIDRAKLEGDTIGGIFEVAATGVPLGLGSYVQWDRRLDGRLAQAFMSIQAIKAVSIGAGAWSAALSGSRFHDEIFWDDDAGIQRGSNRAGGIEGGISNGEELRIQAGVKPIPTLVMPLRSIDLRSKTPESASVERSDTCVVPAAGIVGEAMAALVLADALLEKHGGDSVSELRAHVAASGEERRKLFGEPGKH